MSPSLIVCRRARIVKQIRRMVVFSLLIAFIAVPNSFDHWIEPTASAATTFTVTNTNDSGSGSLRQAIVDANNTPGTDTITFNIGNGYQTIKPLQRLPTLTSPVVIDGTTQPGFSGAPLIELDGSNQADGNGLSIDGGDSTVRGLVINRFHFNGISIGSKGGNRVEGCYIGTDVTGTVARPNGSIGISISSSNNIIGGATMAARNVISGNNGIGVDVSRFCCTGNSSPITQNLIQGNYIGVNAAGNTAIPNTREGIRISSVNANVPVTGNIVGGTQPGAGNVVSGNHSDGVSLDGFYVRSNMVQGNFMGTDATGGFAIPNDGNGLSVTGSDNLIGGSSPGARNVISGNGRNASGVSGGNGVGLGTGSGNIVRGNIIGANAALTAPLPNFLHGLALGGTNNIIGGTAAGEGNIIAFNGLDGIVDATSSSVGNSFRGNSIFSNGSLNVSSNASIGIDLGGSGVTPNDAGDGDAGANNLQNFPVITSVTTGANQVDVKGTLNSTANTSFSLDFYASSACDPLGFGEGTRFVGSATVTSDAGGNAGFDVSFPVTLPPGKVLTATATDPAGNTSEFSQCSAASSAVGSISFSPASVTASEGDGTASFMLIRTGGSAGSLTVNFIVTGQTATAGLDFAPTQGTLTFADGETSKTFTVPLIEDNLDEQTETANLMLSTSGDLDTLGSLNTAVLYIVDNDAPPSLSISDASVTEGNSGTTNATFTVSLSAVSGQIVSVGYWTADNTATAGIDYQAANGTLTFNPGETSKTITVQVNGDTSPEPNESFIVNLGNAAKANIARGQGIGTILNDDAQAPSQLQFNANSYLVNEGAGNATIIVTRSGDTSAVASIDYATADGTAQQRTKYTTASGTLSFAAGETSKNFTVLLTDEAYVEGNQTVNLTLSNPVGATLGNQSMATLTIIDNDIAIPTTNPIDEPRFFVRMQYLDFLNREPDTGGFDYWTSLITSCPSGDTQCLNSKRVSVSAAFFIEQEFQDTGSFVYRFYKASYGQLPTYAQFIADRSRVVGGSNLEAGKQAFAEAWVQRAAFLAKYPATLAPGDFVDQLLATVKTATNNKADLTANRANYLNTLQQSGRGSVLRQIVDDASFKAAEYNNAFVLMQYFGYLRRDPDAEGYNFWLDVLNNRVANNYRGMVCAFITSAEYQDRFSSVRTRNDSICGNIGQ